MNENAPAHKTWLEKIHLALTGEPKDREELVSLLRDAEHRHLLDKDALSMIEAVLQVSSIRVEDIMIPRSHMVSIPHDASLDEILDIVIESKHSRFPVTGETRDEIDGILLAKDLLNILIQTDKKEFNIQDILRPTVIVPESKRIDVLLKEFRTKRNHMAIIVDEYGGVSGLVTIEDVLEQIVGDIEDEHDLAEDIFIKKIALNSYSIKALTPIELFNEELGSGFSDNEFDTIGGLVMQAFGHLPKSGESIDIENFMFKVVHADNRRIHLLQVTQHVLPADEKQNIS